MTDEGEWQAYHMLQCIASLSIQAKTGMHHSRGSIVTLCRVKYGTTGRTAKQTCGQMRELYKARYGEYPLVGEDHDKPKSARKGNKGVDK